MLLWVFLSGNGWKQNKGLTNFANVHFIFVIEFDFPGLNYEWIYQKTLNRLAFTGTFCLKNDEYS